MGATAKYPKIVGYVLYEEIGGGGFSTVYRAVHMESNRVAACKHIRLSENNAEQERKTIDKEMRIHAALKHKHVLEFFNAVVVDPKHQQNYVPGVYMLLEIAGGGDLFDKIEPDVGIEDEVAHNYFMELLSGMDYIHKQGVCHRDLKPENLLLDVNTHLKISDFGLSSVFMLKESGKRRTLTERCGSLPYVAPELNSDRPYEAEPVDLWGIGVILYTLLAGNTPWDEPTSRSPEYRYYVSGEIFSMAPWNRFSADALSLLRSLLCIDPSKRMTISEAFAHPWCCHPSQITDPVSLADGLTQQIRENGDMAIAAPTFPQADVDADGDAAMASQSQPYQTQFTQQLQLFSQTQSGTRYTPSLTRFYATVDPVSLMRLIQGTLESLNVETKEAPPSNNGQTLRMRIGGFDARRENFRGWVEAEYFARGNFQGSFCLMTKDKGSPISWRQLWKALVQSNNIKHHVLRK